MTHCPVCGRPLIYTMDREVRKACSEEGNPNCVRVTTPEELNECRCDRGAIWRCDVHGRESSVVMKVG